MTNPASLPANLDEARLDKLLGRKAALQVAMAVLQRDIDDFCRRYSADHGYCMKLDEVQVLRAMGARHD